jgi:chromate transport protein ChrA
MLNPQNLQLPRPESAISSFYFLRLGSLGFGAPVALCGLMEKELAKTAPG